MPPPPGGMPLPGVPGGQDMQPPMEPEMTEEERKKMELEQDEVFMKYYKIYRITKNLAVIKQKMRQEGLYEPKLIDVSKTKDTHNYL